MNLHVEDFIQGLESGMRMYKQGEDLFSMGNHTMFPNISSQQKWHYVKAGKHVRLTDGNNVFAFEAPEGTKEDEEFPLKRISGVGAHEADKGADSKSTMQVHRADPGQIYFTVQEGRKNPTFTFRHVGGDEWRGIPKTKKKKQEAVIHNVNPSSVLEGAAPKHASFDESARQWLQKGLNAGTNTLLSPGLNPAAAMGVGALGGLGYHYGKRKFYNTAEENEQEGIGDLLRHIAIPAMGAGALGLVESSLAPENLYKEWAATGLMHPPRNLFGDGTK